MQAHHGVKVYKATDCDWVAARGKREVREYLGSIYDENEASEYIEENGGIHELTQEEFNEGMIVCVDEPGQPKISYMENLQDLIWFGPDGIPCIFATTEY